MHDNSTSSMKKSMKNFTSKLSLFTMKPSQAYLLITIGISILFGSCEPVEKKQMSYLDESLKNAPDSFFEGAFVGPQDVHLHCCHYATN